MDNASGLGIGALARVLRVTHLTTGTTAAMKVLSKLQLLQMQKVEAIKMEKRILQLFGRSSSTPPTTTSINATTTTSSSRTSSNNHVASLLGTAQSDDELYIFIEELTGGDLQEHLSRVTKMRQQQHITNPSSQEQQLPVSSAPAASSRWLPGLFCLPFRDVQLVVGQLIDALEPIHTHPNGFTLRDIKSENICFDREGVLTLIDFDAADEQRGLEPECNFGDPLGRKREEKQLKDLSHNPTSVASLGAQQARLEAEARRKTVSEIQGARKMSLINFVGTTQFVSPELLGQMKWSYASDLWAVGVVLYQCVFGRYPFDGSNPFEIMKEIVKGVEPWKHFPLYHDERVRRNANINSSSPSSSSSDLFTEDQYAAVCDLIESLLQLDPVRRIGVPGSASLRLGTSSSSGIPPNICRAVPEYSQLRSHAFFEGFDWSGLKSRVEAAVHPPPGNNSSPSSAPPTTTTLMDMYTIPPSHDEEYSVEVEDACAVGSPLTDWVVGHVEEENENKNTLECDVADSTMTPSTPQSERDIRAAKMEADLKAISARRSWLEAYEKKYISTSSPSTATPFTTQVVSGHIAAHKLHLDLEAEDVRESGHHALKEMDAAIERKRLLEKRKQDERMKLANDHGEARDTTTAASSAASHKSTPIPLGVSNPYAPTTERLDAIDIRRILQEGEKDDEDDTDHRIVDDVGVQQSSYQPVHPDFQ